MVFVLVPSPSPDFLAIAIKTYMIWNIWQYDHEREMLTSKYNSPLNLEKLAVILNHCSKTIGRSHRTQKSAARPLLPSSLLLSASKMSKSGR